MLIRSEQRDYYDCIMGMGYDPNLVYDRHAKEEKLEKVWPFDKPLKYRIFR